MKRKLLSALLSVAMVATLLVGCGSTTKTETETAVVEDEAATEEVATDIDDEGNALNETRLVNVYELVDVSEQMKQWKLLNYQLLREPLYPKQSEYLDAMVKGDELAIQLYKDKCLAVKNKYPKE